MVSILTIARERRRWGDNDHHFGPFTFAYDRKWRPFTAVLCSGSDAHEDPGCCVRLQGLGFTAFCEMPPIVKPQRTWVDMRDKEWARGDGYWDEHPREYGFSLSDGHFHVSLGAQTGDSRTTEDWSCFLPWTQWRVIADRQYDADGVMVADIGALKGRDWEKSHEIRKNLKKAHFAIRDYDGEHIDVETYATEMEWRLGTGWFRWLGYIAPVKRRRSLDISFGSETGTEKGSWKGGTVGTGIDMEPGETQEAAFRRYCSQTHRAKGRDYKVTFVDV